MEKLLDIDELAGLIGIKKATLYQWASQGKIPHLKIGRLLKFRESDISAWIDRSFRAPSVQESPQRKGRSRSKGLSDDHIERIINSAKRDVLGHGI